MTNLSTERVFKLRSLSLVMWMGSLLIALLAAVSGDAQTPKRAEDLMQALKNGSYNAASLNELAAVGAVQAIPELRKQFDLTTDSSMKGAIASALIRIGDKDPTYWDFLVKRASQAIENDAPFPIDFDVQGKSVRSSISPEFVKWSKAHHVDPESASHVLVYEVPQAVLLLAVTGDERGRVLLRKGMSSPNYLIQAISAKGLAKLQDKDSIGLIADACNKAPAEMAAVIAQALVFFDEPQAQAAAERYITNPQVLGALRKMRQDRGLDVLF
jgi:hypothetical protein